MESLELYPFAAYIKPRPREFHKGDAGFVLIVGGERGYSGAVCLAGEAALRVGAGLVSVGTRIEHSALISVTRPEIMSHGIEKPADLDSLLERSHAIVIGPGLGKTDWSKALLATIFQSEKPLVVDADALNLLAENPMKKSNWILTPHPGEAARLLKQTVAEVQADRVAAVTKIQSMYGGVCVLKGMGSLVVDETGVPVICEFGNPGMATAGMGDALSGVIGSLLAQRIPLAASAKLGVLMHALAGDYAAEKNGERGMIASDLLVYLRVIANK